MGRIANNNNAGRGTAGGRRNTPARSAKQLTRRRRREEDPRYKAALDEIEATEQQIAKLDAELAADTGPAAGAQYAGQHRAFMEARQKEREGLVTRNEAAKVTVEKLDQIPTGGNGGKGWTLGQARSMLHQGYKLWHVVKTTGFGSKHFEDIPLDKDGRGISREEWIELQDKKSKRLDIESRRLNL